MDPLSAISLASAVISFIDFGSELLSDAHEIYHSANGLSKGFEGIQDACKRSEEVTLAIQSKTKITGDESLRRLADSCLDTSKEIARILNGMESAGNGKHTGKLRSVRKALVQYRGKGKVEELNQKLQRHSRDLSYYLIYMTR
ncbi:hypothetical protein N8I77_010089 [Diaporthe amygdali]|uniref:NACHT-NTPase and P-loop NTPases N-terminal domain-containing protein n=1 Tax=Phomopsis amygdali TaxID=1214568 RepID=A0AAD9VYS4_PHOAM|nr:hypothetical protein N8I77_010089 [Diaporthe amygdali]